MSMSEVSDVLKQYAAGAISKEALIRGLMAADLVIIASYETLEDTVLRIQDYVMDGQPYIPIFSDGPTADRLLTGVSLPTGMRLVQASGGFLLSLFQSNEWLVLNAGSEHAVSLYADEIRPFLGEVMAHSLQAGALEPGLKPLGGGRLLATEPIAVQIGMPAHPPAPALLGAMREAVAPTGAQEVYWFWMSLSGGPPHLGLAVRPDDSAIWDRVGRAIEPLWAKHSPANPTVTVVPLDGSAVSDRIRAIGKRLYGASGGAESAGPQDASPS